MRARLARRITQAAEKAGEAKPLVRRAAPSGLPFLELHHVVDSAVEEGAGLDPAFALVVEPGQQGRAINRTKGHALGVVVEVGAGIARDAPHEVGGAPADAK